MKAVPDSVTFTMCRTAAYTMNVPTYSYTLSVCKIIDTTIQLFSVSKITIQTCT